MEDKDKKLVFKYLLSYSGKYKNEKFIFKPSREALRIIQDYVKGVNDDDKQKKLNVYLNLRKYFSDTERKKSPGGGGGKKNSQYDYDPNDHENQRKTLEKKNGNNF